MTAERMGSDTSLCVLRPRTAEGVTVRRVTAIDDLMYLAIPSVTGAVNCGHGCPDYLYSSGVNPASFQAFARDALLMFGAVAVGYLVIAALPPRRLTTDAV